MYNIVVAFRYANKIIAIIVVPELSLLSMYIYILWMKRVAMLLLNKLSDDSSISLSGSIYKIHVKLI